MFELEVTPKGGRPYTVRHREIVSSVTLSSYQAGTAIACRIDPTDDQRIAFGEKPFL